MNGFRRGRQRAGFTFSEVLITMLITMSVLTVVYRQLVALYDGEMTASNEAQGTADNRMAIDTMADHLRNAVLNTSTTTGVNDSALSAASASSFTYYTSATSGATVTYALSGTNLTRTASGGSAVTEAYNLSSLTFTYYKQSTYDNDWTTTTNANAPTAAELPSVCAVLIDASTLESGVTAHMTTVVRLRNSPLKVNMSGQ